MSDRSGQSRALNVFTPIRPGEEEALRTYLGDLPHGPESPLARSGRTHVARWVIIDHLPTDCVPKPDRLRRIQLLFTSSFDGDERTYLDDLVRGLASEVSDVWGRCEGYPHSAGPSALVDWLLAHRVPTAFFFAAYKKSTVHDVCNALAAREQTIAFALRAQGMAPPARLQAFREAFP